MGRIGLACTMVGALCLMACEGEAPRAPRAFAGGLATSASGLRHKLPSPTTQRRPEPEQAPASKNAKLGARALARRCKRSDPDACVRLGVILTRSDLPRAAHLFEKACKRGFAAGCGNLGAMYLGRGKPANRTKAIDLLSRACDGEDAESCANLADVHSTDGHRASANEFHGRACRLGHEPSCPLAHAL